MTQDGEVGQYIINALEEKFMSELGFLYVIISEDLHISLNSNEPVQNELLHNGLSFLVEQGVE